MSGATAPDQTDRARGRGAIAAAASLELGSLRLQARARCSPWGFLAIGAMVSMILLSVPPIILAARARR